MLRYQVVNVMCMKKNSHDVKKVFPALAAAGDFQDLLEFSLVPVLGQLHPASPGLQDVPDGVRFSVVTHGVHI